MFITGSLKVGDRGGVVTIRARQGDKIFGFEDGKGSHKPRHASGLSKLKKARTWILPQSFIRSAVLQKLQF